MSFKILLLAFALVTLSFSGIVVTHSSGRPSLEQQVHSILSRGSNPNDVYNSVKFNPLAYATVEVEVSLSELDTQWHIVAHRQFVALYPHYANSKILKVTYSTLGLNRYYTFKLSDKAGDKQAKVAIKVHTQFTRSIQSEDEADGYSQISVEWAQKDPTASYALQLVIKQNWNAIKANPLKQCWQKPVGGVWSFRFYFSNVVGKFEYAVGEAHKEQNGTYFAEVQPVYVVGDVQQYKNFSIEEFKKSPAYKKVVDELTKSIGHFEQAWILHVSISITNGVNYIKVVVNFQPFLLKQTYQAHYFGSVQKASLLKVDEKVFNPTGKSYESWQQIKNFSSLKAFDEAYQCITYTFTWLRFYKVVAAYSALHKKGRSIRLVFAGIGEFVDPQNQINIVMFVDQFGKYFFDRSDFHATHLNSYGRNNWVSLFVSTPDVTKAEYYQKIVKFFKSIYPKYWSAHLLTDIKFKGDLHVITFQNPTNDKRIGVLNINKEGEVKLLNNHTWIKLQQNSPIIDRLESYVRGKYKVSKVMFIQFRHSNDGTEFQVAYLDDKNDYRACYLHYIDENDVFTESKQYKYDPIIFDRDTYLNPLPKDVQQSVIAYLIQQKINIVAVLGFIELSRNQFAVVALLNHERWQVNLKWENGVWRVVSKVPYNDGYFTAYGYPSVTVASCTGFLARLYPIHFSKPYVYVNIQTKSVGVSLYHRIVYDFGDKSFEASVELTFGVKNSHIHHYWMPVSYYKKSHDYGYGSAYDYIYGVSDESLIHKVEAKEQKKQSLTKQPKVEAVVAKVQEAFAVSVECPPGTKPNIFGGICLPVF